MPSSAFLPYPNSLTLIIAACTPVFIVGLLPFPVDNATTFRAERRLFQDGLKTSTSSDLEQISFLNLQSLQVNYSCECLLPS
jgi:hypothetical protein